MPEGDSVYQLSKRLQWMTRREVLKTSIRVPRYATVDFTGMTCERVWPYGKHLFMQFAAPGHQPQILHTHLKMEGTWAMHCAGTHWKKPAHAARVVLLLDDAQRSPIELVGFWLGVVRVFPAREFEQEMGYLGPDVLAPHFDAAEAIRRIKASPQLEIGRALLDQRNLAGIGNEYRAEINFLAGTHPAQRVGDVDVDKHVHLARRLIWANKDEPVRVTTGIKRAGETSYVFGRYGKPCRRCGSIIQKGFLGGEGDLERVIWWCPTCQPAPDAP